MKLVKLDVKTGQFVIQGNEWLNYDHLEGMLIDFDYGALPIGSKGRKSYVELFIDDIFLGPICFCSWISACFGNLTMTANQSVGSCVRIDKVRSDKFWLPILGVKINK